MKATSVVKAFDIVEKLQTSLLDGGGLLVRKALGFERGHEAFHQGVVVAIGLTTHSGSDADTSQEQAKWLAGILNASIRMVQEPRIRAAISPSSLQGFCNQSRMQIVKNRVLNIPHSTLN